MSELVQEYDRSKDVFCECAHLNTDHLPHDDGKRHCVMCMCPDFKACEE
jgi:hypothetical protein